MANAGRGTIDFLGPARQKTVVWAGRTTVGVRLILGGRVLRKGPAKDKDDGTEFAGPLVNLGRDTIVILGPARQKTGV